MHLVRTATFVGGYATFAGVIRYVRRCPGDALASLTGGTPHLNMVNNHNLLEPPVALAGGSGKSQKVIRPGCTSPGKKAEKNR